MELSAGRSVQAPGIFKLLCDSIDIMPLRNTAYYGQQDRYMDSKKMSERFTPLALMCLDGSIQPNQ